MESLDDVSARLEAARLEAGFSPAPGGGTGQGMDVVRLWPELFEGLDERRSNAIRQSFASHWHEGWEPDRGEVADLAALWRGVIGWQEYLDRGDERVRRRNRPVR